MVRPSCAAIPFSTRRGSISRACHPEPLISCGLAGSAEFRERELGDTWVARQIGRGHIFVTRSKTPYEVSHSSTVGQELEIIQIHGGGRSLARFVGIGISRESGQGGRDRLFWTR